MHCPYCLEQMIMVPGRRGDKMFMCNKNHEMVVVYEDDQVHYYQNNTVNEIPNVLQCLQKLRYLAESHGITKKKVCPFNPDNDPSICAKCPLALKSGYCIVLDIRELL